MKKAFKICFAVLMTALIIAVSCAQAFAASEKLTVNGKAKAKAGDTLTYTLKLGDCTDMLEGIQMYVFYDKDCLEVDADSLKFPSLNGAVFNANYSDGIAFNWTSVTDLVSFKKTKELMTVDFKVKKAGDTNITYFVTEMYGKDMTYFKTFTLTNDISVNGKKVVKDEVPVLSTDSAMNNKYQGTFINYSDGKGTNGKGSGHQMVTGVTTSPVNQNANAATEVTKGEQAPVTTIIVVIGVVLAILAIIVLVILRRHFSKETED